MAAPTLIYVDPAINANTGAGTIGSPYGDTQYALNTWPRDATNGNQVCLKAGTDEILTATLSLATYGTPTAAAPLILSGYTAAANDGGIGGISGAGSFAITNTAIIHYYDMRLHNTGASNIISTAQFGIFYNCTFENTSASALSGVSFISVERCYFTDIGVSGISSAVGSAAIRNCYFKNGTKKFTIAVLVGAGTTSPIEFNVFKLDSSSIGIQIQRTNFAATVANNSIYSSGGTGTGININTSVATMQAVSIINNIIEGFSGVGGKGIALATAENIALYGNNKFYNNAANESFSGDVFRNIGGNDTLLASPFTNPGGDDFSVSAAVKAGAYPSSFRGASTNNYLDVGAAQRQEPTGGGRSFRIRGHGI